MAEYIDREALIERLKFKRNNDDWNNSKYRGLECAIAQVKKAPAADVVEVKHGRWEIELDDFGWNKHTCSLCGYVKRTDIHVSLGWNYCPNCGAKMEEERKE